MPEPIFKVRGLPVGFSGPANRRWRKDPARMIVKFEISAELINKPTLKIRGARIVAANLATLEGKGVIKCEGITVLNRSMGTFVLDDDLSFGSGIPIPRTPIKTAKADADE